MVGGAAPNQLRFIKPKGQDDFSPIPAAADLYWSDVVGDSDVIFAKKTKDGALLVFDGAGFAPSPIPEKGHTHLGEFLPWYSKAIDGFFTAWRADIWFHRPGDPGWRQVQESEIQFVGAFLGFVRTRLTGHS